MDCISDACVFNCTTEMTLLTYSLTLIISCLLCRALTEYADNEDQGEKETV